MPDVATPSAPANAAPSAVPATPTAPAAPATAPAGTAQPAPAAPRTSPIRDALSALPQNATWADASRAITGAQAAATAAPPADTGQPRDELGRFASPDADPNAALPEGAVPVSDTATGEDGDAAAPDGEEAAPEAEASEPEPIVVKLTGRNGEELEFAVDSEADADVLRQLKNDGMRREEFNRKSADLEKGFTQLREIGAKIQADPEGFMIGELTPERQVSTARALLLNNWDTLAPEIEQFWNDPVARRQAMLDVRQSSMQRAADVSNLIAGYQAATQAERTIAGLIPETASEQDADAFFADATAYLTGLAQQGRSVPAAEIPQALSRLVAAHGFGASEPAAVPATPAASTAQSATTPAPASDPLAERKAKAAAQVRRMTQVAKQRQAAARVAPQGAGAAAVEAPKPPKGADIKTTTDFLKGRITRGTTWSDLLGRRG